MVISHDYHSISFHIWLPYNWGHNCTYHYLSRGHNRSGMSQSHPWREQFRLFIMNEMIWWPEAKLVDLICLPTFCPNILKSYHIKSTTPMQLDCSCVDDMGLSENGVPHYHGLSLIMIIWSYFLHSNVIFGFVCFGLEITRQTEVSNHQHPLSRTLLGIPFKPWHVVEPTWCNVREFVDSCSPAKSSSNLVGLNMGITLW